MFYHVPREKRGEGVGLCLSKRFTHVTMIKSLNYTSFEYIHINFSLANKLYKFIVLYRPPPKTNFNNFINEFYSLMSSLFDENRKVYVCGDFTIWTEDDTDHHHHLVFCPKAGPLTDQSFAKPSYPGLTFSTDGSFCSLLNHPTMIFNLFFSIVVAGVLLNYDLGSAATSPAGCDIAASLAGNLVNAVIYASV